MAACGTATGCCFFEARKAVGEEWTLQTGVRAAPPCLAGLAGEEEEEEGAAAVEVAAAAAALAALAALAAAEVPGLGGGMSPSKEAPGGDFTGCRERGMPPLPSLSLSGVLPALAPPAPPPADTALFFGFGVALRDPPREEVVVIPERACCCLTAAVDWSGLKTYKPSSFFRGPLC